MKTNSFVTGAVALASLSAPLAAQSMTMPGMMMPMRANKVPAKKPAKGTHPSAAKSKSGGAQAHRPTTTGVATPHARGRVPTVLQHQPQSHATMQMPMGHSAMQHGAVPKPAQPLAAGQVPMTMPIDQPHLGSGTQDQMSMEGMQHTAAVMNMKAALGPYPEQRESSGTAWQPDASKPMGGPMLMSGKWMFMAHATVNLVYDQQSGPRGDEEAFASGMLMGMAQGELGAGTLRLRAMFSPDPLMGPSGYPLLLASGETANGRDRLIDRQHPHDFVMELSASASQRLGLKSSVFVYAGLPGEPAFGPPSFMHRESILDSPEAPITHHWLDSTHITFGVVTAGLVLDRVKVEASRFNGREPDQHRWGIETGPLDSSSVRVSWNPLSSLALQGSWAHLVEPEQLEPRVNQTRWSASVLWADDLAPGWHAAAMLAWGRKSSLGHSDDGLAAEASLSHAGWTVFGRGETVKNRELIQDQEEPAYRVGKVSVGAVRDFRIDDNLSVGAGGLFSVNFVGDALASLYGSRNPTGMMGFVRLKLH